MELLIIKSGNDYIRVKKEKYFLVRLDKASVFPMEKLNLVKLHKSRLNMEGFKEVDIKRLILTEKDL